MPTITIITGCSAAGKTTTFKALQKSQRIGKSIAIHEIDEDGVPPVGRGPWQGFRVEQLLFDATERAKKGISSVICGIIFPHQITESIYYPDPKIADVQFIMLSTTGALISERLREREKGLKGFDESISLGGIRQNIKQNLLNQKRLVRAISSLKNGHVIDVSKLDKTAMTAKIEDIIIKNEKPKTKPEPSSLFIIGANGQLGTALRTQYPEARFADKTELDITDSQSVESFDWSGISIILNAAAFTNVDGAETPEGRVAAWKVNASAVANLTRACRAHDMTLVHISSDYVFDGTKEPHYESEDFSPLSVYGASKAAGDLLVEQLDKFYLLRTTWVIGEGKNFVRTMLGLAEKNISPTVVHDQIGRLTFTSELVRIIDHLLSTQAPFGTYNATNDGPLESWADITRRIFKLAERDDLTVTNTTTAEYFAGKDGIAPRPLGSNMSLEKLHATGFSSRDWTYELKDYILNQKEFS